MRYLWTGVEREEVVEIEGVGMVLLNLSWGREKDMRHLGYG